MQPETQQPVQTSTPLEPGSHSHVGMYLAVGLSLLAVAGLLFVVLVLPKYQPASKIQSGAPLETQSTVQNQVDQTTPAPINNKQNLDSASQTLDSTDVTQINAGLDQNSKDTSTFGQ